MRVAHDASASVHFSDGARAAVGALTGGADWDFVSYDPNFCLNPIWATNSQPILDRA